MRRTKLALISLLAMIGVISTAWAAYIFVDYTNSTLTHNQLGVEVVGYTEIGTLKIDTVAVENNGLSGENDNDQIVVIYPGMGEIEEDEPYTFIGEKIKVSMSLKIESYNGTQTEDDFTGIYDNDEELITYLLGKYSFNVTYGVVDDNKSPISNELLNGMFYDNPTNGLYTVTTIDGDGNNPGTLYKGATITIEFEIHLYQIINSVVDWNSVVNALKDVNTPAVLIDINIAARGIGVESNLGLEPKPTTPAP